MLKVLFFTPGPDPSGKSNVGDRVILAGVRNLIASAFGVYGYAEAGRWSRKPFVSDDYDLVVFAGMPQYGARGQVEEAELRFDGLLKQARRAKVINIGGGTPAHLNPDVEAISDRMAAAANAAYFKGQTALALRTTRDLIGKRFFDKIGMECDLRPCPSFFSTLHIERSPPSRDAIALVNDATFVTAHVRGSVRDHIRRLMARLPGFEATSHARGDLAILADLGVPHTYFRTEMDAIAYYATIGRLASLRIHAAVPAWTLGADVAVGAFDSRVCMFEDTGMPLPWVNLVDNPFEALADVLEDPTRHVAAARRQELIDTALLSFVERLRNSLPDLTARARMETGDPAGLAVYPPEGRVLLHPSGRFLPPRAPRPPVFVDEDDGRKSGCIHIPAGGRAKHGEDRRPALPIRVEGHRLVAATGVAHGDALRIGLEKTGVAAHAPELRLPYGYYRATVRFRWTSARGKEPARLALKAKTRSGAYGEGVVPIARTRARAEDLEVTVEFEHAYEAAALLLDIVARGNVAGAELRLLDLTIDRAKIEATSADDSKTKAATS